MTYSASRSRRYLATFVAMTAVLVLVMGPTAQAYTSIPFDGYQERTGNPGPFPDSCNIRGGSLIDVIGPRAAAVTTEDANCARLQVKLRYKPSENLFVTRIHGFTYTSNISTGYVKPIVAIYWSDHNGDNNGSGTTYGFRVNW